LPSIVDSNYKFIYVDIGAFGKDCDTSIFKETIFWKLLEQKKLNIPDPEPIITNDILLYALVGDEAFALSENLLRPYGGNNLSVEKRVFNYRLTRARRYEECAFGILTNKWRIMHRLFLKMNVSKKFAKDIVKACVVLHNIVRQHDGFYLEEELTISENQGLIELQHVPVHNRGGRSANHARDQLANILRVQLEDYHDK
jgi:hypothetical protein